jgi:uncharacterized damage-inducible protein DinB
MKRVMSLLAVTVLAQAPLSAQAGAVSGLGAVYGTGKGFLVRAAEQMPDEHWTFKPTPEVRSFGEIVGHVANANYMICAQASGTQNPKQGVNAEKLATRAEVVQALKDAFAFCDQAHQMTDAKGVEPMDIFGMKTNRLGALAFNAAHNMEHYGNLVTYMRLKGLTPPSSQR